MNKTFVHLDQLSLERLNNGEAVVLIFEKEKLAVTVYPPEPDAQEVRARG